jgi:peptide/nickel transport system substrate-binding protein
MILAITTPVFSGGAQEAEPEEAATGVAARTGEYGEAPMLAEMVQRGELPPVDERLPADPAVVDVVEEIGQYGGSWDRSFLGASDMSGPARITYDPPIRWNVNASDLEPNLAKNWEVSDDGTEFVFYLREGVKWSDGEPFTADDMLFWYEDMIMNDELYPAKPWWLRAGGETGVMTKVDDYTIQWTFADSYGLFPRIIATHGHETTFPKHYLSLFHVDYADADELDAMVNEAGYEEWYQLFQDKMSRWTHTERPVIQAWKAATPNSAERFVMERNPYYWKVDAEGNQLPYIDEIVHSLAENSEIVNFRASAGDLDMQFRHLDIKNYTLFMEGRDAGDYRVMTWTTALGADVMFMPNQNHKDPVLREIIRDDRFRKALSLAINREEINELVYLGLGTPRQATIIPECVYYKDSYGQAFADYDPARANEFLDDMGLTERDADGFRLRPDGETLSLTIEVPAGIFGPWTDTCELVKDYWDAIGVRTSVDSMERSLYVQRSATVDPEVGVWSMDRSLTPFSHPYWWVPQTSYSWAPIFGQWYASGGSQGEKPTGPILELMELYDQIKAVADDNERMRLAHRFFDIHEENVFVIGTVGMVPSTMGLGVVANNFRNVPEDAVTDVLQLSPGNTHCEQYFIRQ